MSVKIIRGIIGISLWVVPRICLAVSVTPGSEAEVGPGCWLLVAGCIFFLLVFRRIIDWWPGWRGLGAEFKKLISGSFSQKEDIPSEENTQPEPDSEASVEEARHDESMNENNYGR